MFIGICTPLQCLVTDNMIPWRNPGDRSPY